MSLSPGTHSVGPGSGRLQVQTYREGVAQMVGHDLIIDVGQWQATVDVGPASFELELRPDGSVGATLSVTQSEWGIKPYRGLMGALKVKDAVEIVLGARLPSA